MPTGKGRYRTGSSTDIVNKVIGVDERLSTLERTPQNQSSPGISSVLTAAIPTQPTFEVTQNTSYTDLWGGFGGEVGHVGPAVTVTIGESGMCLVFLTAYTETNAGTIAIMSTNIVGPTNVAPADDFALKHGTQSSALYLADTVMIPYSGLTAGNYTFTAQYRSFEGSFVSFGYRAIAVMPL